MSGAFPVICGPLRKPTGTEGIRPGVVDDRLRTSGLSVLAPPPPPSGFVVKYPSMPALWAAGMTTGVVNECFRFLLGGGGIVLADFSRASLASARRARMTSRLSLRVLGNEFLRGTLVDWTYEDQRRTRRVVVSMGDWGVTGRWRGMSGGSFVPGGKGTRNAFVREAGFEVVAGTMQGMVAGRVFVTSFRGEGGRWLLRDCGRETWLPSTAGG